MKLSNFEKFEVIFGATLLFVLSLLMGLALASSAPAVSANMSLSQDGSSQYSFDELSSNASRTLLYVRGSASEELLSGTGPRYDENEISHLRDVRQLLAPALLAVFPVLLLALVFFYRGFFGSKARVLDAALKGALVLSGAIFGGLGIIGLLSFSLLFEKFHELLFPQGNWTFAADSLLIQTFPLQFWVNEAILVLIGVVLTNLVYFSLRLLLKQYGKLSR